MINETINELPKDTNDEVTIKRGRGRPRVEPKPKPIKEKKHSLFLDDPKAYFKNIIMIKPKEILYAHIVRKDLHVIVALHDILKKVRIVKLLDWRNCQIIKMKSYTKISKLSKVTEFRY